MEMRINDLRDLLLYELRDMYDAEKQLVDALPKMAEACSSSKLKKAFEDHLDETIRQKKRLEQISEILEVELGDITCEAMKGLIKEGEEFIHMNSQPDVKDAGLIAAAQRVEHYEIAAYGAAINYAERLGYDQVSDLLSDTLNEEKQADAKLNKIAIRSVNEKAESIS